MAITIEAVTAVDDVTAAVLARLLGQLTPRHSAGDPRQLRQIVESPDVTLLVARDDADIVGTASLVIVPLPSGVRARLEDVVVDESARGRGTGRGLIAEAVGRARAAGARDLDLVVPPHRTVAIAAYVSAGFEQVPTGVFRHPLRSTPGQGQPPSGPSSS